MHLAECKRGKWESNVDKGNVMVGERTSEQTIDFFILYLVMPDNTKRVKYQGLYLSKHECI